ncbi:MAG: transglycosylase SLT domain-containing protein [Acidimicrobiia bacterium]
MSERGRHLARSLQLALDTYRGRGRAAGTLQWRRRGLVAAFGLLVLAAGHSPIAQAAPTVDGAAAAAAAAPAVPAPAPAAVPAAPTGVVQAAAAVEPVAVSIPPAPVPIEAVIAAVWGELAPSALGVASCESTMNPEAVGGNGRYYGLFQIGTIHQGLVEALGFTWDQIFDPYVNTIVAKAVFDEAGGWSPWGCRWAA